MASQTVVADETLIILHAAAALGTRGSMLEVLSVRVGQQGVTTNQQLGILIAQKVTAFGTYTSTTPTPLIPGAAASGIAGGTAGAAATAGTDASAEGAGAVTNIISDSFSCLNGWLWIPTPEERIIIGPDIAVIVKLVGTPGTLTGWTANMVYRELA